jgi:hypothetical protein
MYIFTHTHLRLHPLPLLWSILPNKLSHNHPSPPTHTYTHTHSLSLSLSHSLTLSDLASGGQQWQYWRFFIYLFIYLFIYSLTLLQGVDSGSTGDSEVFFLFIYYLLFILF